MGATAMTPSRFTIRTLAAITHEGRRVLSGSEVEAEAGVVIDLIRSGKARLTGPDDLRRLIDAAAKDRLIGAVHRPPAAHER